MTTRKRRTRRTNASNDEAQARIAIHLQRMAVDLAAARKELHRLYGPGIDEEIDMLAAMGRNIKIIHNRHSHIKQS